ncbi:MAG: hypothetical protein AB1690_08700 [Candidatus Zixiibacteriota bacterium]|jgi:hypothetical protein
MKEVKSRKLLGVALTLLLAAVGNDSRAEGRLLESSRHSEFSLSVSKASFSHENELTLTTSALILRGQAELPGGFYFVGELPFSHYDLGGNSSREAELLFGNPYLGFRFELPGSSPLFGLGFRPSLISEENDKTGAMFIGAFSDFEQFEAYLPEVTTVYASGGYKIVSLSGYSIRMLLGPALYLISEEDDELLAQGTIEFLYEKNRYNFGIGLGSKIWLTESDLDFGERNLQYFKFRLGVSFDRLTPCLHLTAPLDEDFILGVRQNLNYVWGIDLKVALDK